MAQYGGDTLQAMPWTSDLVTLEEFQLWAASRPEVGLKIDIETCERGSWKAYDCDVYGLQEAKGELPEEMRQVGTNRFVRSPESRGWVNEEDLPFEKREALYERINREADTYENYLKRPKNSRELWQAKDELWRVVTNCACFIRWENDRAAAVREPEKLGEKLRAWHKLHPVQANRRTGDRAVRAVCNLVESVLATIGGLPKQSPLRSTFLSARGCRAASRVWKLPTRPSNTVRLLQGEPTGLHQLAPIRRIPQA